MSPTVRPGRSSCGSRAALELLQLVGEVEDGLQLVGAPASDAREVPPLQVFRDLDHAGRGCYF